MLSFNLFPNDNPKREALTAYEKDQILERQNYKCAICKASLVGKMGVIPHYDHKTSLGADGLDSISNIQAICPNCKSKKTSGDRHIQAKKRSENITTLFNIKPINLPKPAKLPKFKRVFD